MRQRIKFTRTETLVLDVETIEPIGKLTADVMANATFDRPGAPRGVVMRDLTPWSAAIPAPKAPRKARR